MKQSTEEERKDLNRKFTSQPGICVQSSSTRIMEQDQVTNIDETQIAENHHPVLLNYGSNANQKRMLKMQDYT